MKTKDLSNKKFGKLKVLYKTNLRNHGSIVWHCICDCGKECDISSRDLVNQYTRSCGCFRKENKGVNPNDLLNQRFGRLKVIEMTNKRKNNSIVWKCICDCGNVCEKTSCSLVSGKCLSCGCLKEESIKENQKRVCIQTIENQFRSSNTSGIIGVCFDKSTDKWLATIGINGKDYYLIRSKDKEKAIQIRKKAEQEILKPMIEQKIPLEEDTIRRKIQYIKKECI